MATEFILPLMGEGVVEAQIGRWLVQVGDTVEEGDPIVEVETDKVTTELDAEFSGTILEILVQEGETAALNQTLALIDGGEQATDNRQQITDNKKQQSTANSQQSTTNEWSAQPTTKPANQQTRNGEYNGRISPVVRRMVDEHGLNLDNIHGTGKDGRITKRDVLVFLDQQTTDNRQLITDNENNQQSTTNNQQSTKDRPFAPSPTRPSPPTHQHTNTPSQLQPISNMRRKIAEHMVMSKRESPHATTVFEIDFGNVAANRAREKANFAERGVKLTYMAYIGTAVTQALQQVPMANAEWRDEGILQHKAIHLGMATAIDNGLVVPVIKKADTLNLLGFAAAIQDMAEKARANQLKSDDLQGGTFTITNHGVFGSLFATPIINQPQSGILGIGTIEKRVCVVDDMIAIRPKSYFSLSFDHRILDGADADRFMQIVKQTLEGWQP